MNVVILHDRIALGARADELDALVQAEAISGALSELGHRSTALPFSLNLSEVQDALRQRRPDAVFNIVESVEGYGRLIHLAPALLEAMGLSYTGASADGTFLTSNKVLTKRWLRANGMDTPDWSSLTDATRAFSNDRREEDAIQGGTPFAPGSYIIKSVWEDASVGLDAASIVRANDEETLRSAVRERLDRLGGAAFAERFVDGREFNLSILEIDGGPQVLPPAEIHFVDYPADKPRIVDYEAKWDESSFGYSHTPRSFEFPASDASLIAQLKHLAIRCWRLFELSGYARVDFRVDRDGKPWVLEINANPCLSPDAGFAAAVHRAGMEYAAPIDKIMASALRRGARNRMAPGS